jgi:hypothetical protein
MKEQIVNFSRKHIYGKVILLIVSGIILFPLFHAAYKTVRNVFAYDRIEKSILTLLKSENLSFLVTNKLTTQVVVDITNNSPILGKREGILIGTVSMYYGIDLKEIDPSSVKRYNNVLTIKLPAPKELDFSVDPCSFKYITKRSGLNIIADYVMNKDIEAELRTNMKKSAEKFFTDHNMFPTHKSIINQLNNYFEPFIAQFGMEIKFE